MLIRIALCFTASLVAALMSTGAYADAAEPDASQALVVLIGNAGTSDELRSVLSELLGRDGVSVEYRRRPRFSQSALLSESRDARVWVFVSEPGPHVVKLYFRGPSGERFLLRQLALKNGLDELGRELIGQVVETSTVALLHSTAGVSREEARAGLSAEEDDAETSGSDRATTELDGSKVTADQGTTARRRELTRLEYQLDARGFVKWSGQDLSVDHGIGMDMALAFHLSRRLFLRGRGTIEDGLGQSIDTGGLAADVHTTSVRGGLDVGTSFGDATLSFGALAGADFTKVVPKASSNPSLLLADESHGTVPVIRVEARYELTVGAFRATAGIFGDGGLAATRYDVSDPSGQHRVAAPWPVRPGIALTVGLRTGS